MISTPLLGADERVLLLTLSRKDGALAQHLLGKIAVPAVPCDNVAALCEQLSRGAAAILIAEEFVPVQAHHELVGWLHGQPPWSDLPVLVLRSNETSQDSAERVVRALGNAILIERPVRISTFLSLVRTAVGARHRQYQLRDQMIESTQLNASLETRVRERTAVAEERTRQLAMLAAEITRAEARERRRLAQVLHDHLQQLLVAARLHLGMLQSHDSSDATTRETILGVDRMLRECLEASRSLTLELSPPVLYECGLLAGLHWVAGTMLERHGLRATVRGDEQDEPLALDVRILLFEAARELLFNIVKHSGVADAAMRISRGKDRSVQLLVEDRGRGFDPQVLEQRRPGEHFGLFNIQQRLRLLGGDLEIRSDLASGTTIMAVVPEVAADRPGPGSIGTARSTRASAAADSLEGSRVSEKIRVIVADDHEIVREGIARLLREQSDVEVVGEASTGLEAIALSRRLRPAVVVMDVAMPEMNGIEATRQIRETLPETRVIGLSMHRESEMAVAMRRAGAFAYVPKDGPMSALLDQIRQVPEPVSSPPSGPPPR